MDAETRAVSASPVFQRLIAQGRASKGKRGFTTDELAHQLGITQEDRDAARARLLAEDPDLHVNQSHPKAVDLPQPPPTAADEPRSPSGIPLREHPGYDPERHEFVHLDPSRPTSVTVSAAPKLL